MLAAFMFVAAGGCTNVDGPDRSNDAVAAASPSLTIDSQNGELRGVRVGMTEEELLALGFPTVASSVFEEGEEYRTIQVTVADGVVLDALFASKVLHRFTLTSPRVTDSLGLGVGTSLGELRKSYSNGRLFIGYEAGKHANFVSDSKVIYRLDLKSINEACFEAETRDEQRYVSEKCVGEDVRVKSLVVTLSAG